MCWLHICFTKLLSHKTTVDFLTTTSQQNIYSLLIFLYIIYSLHIMRCSTLFFFSQTKCIVLHCLFPQTSCVVEAKRHSFIFILHYVNIALKLWTLLTPEIFQPPFYICKCNLIIKNIFPRYTLCWTLFICDIASVWCFYATRIEWS